MIRIGVVSPSEIAFRRFMPALMQCSDFQYVGIAIASAQEWFDADGLSRVSKSDIECVQKSERSKAVAFQQTYGGYIFDSYQSMIEKTGLDAVYIPLPPALHYKWAQCALKAGKHVFVEKPSTTCFDHTRQLVELAKSHSLALHENYMFMYHSQIAYLDQMIADGEVGDVRLVRLSFGFPRRKSTDFRYNKKLGGGALLDAGGYTLRYAHHLLGSSVRMVCATKQNISDFDVEIMGAATLVNDFGVTAQVAFGMDNDYRCSVEIWGSKGSITSDRIFTAPIGFQPRLTIKRNNEFEEQVLAADDTFQKSIQRFARCVSDEKVREEEYQLLLEQEHLVDEFINLSK